MQRSTVRLPGAHRVVKRLANGSVAIYWYRRRGGPLLMRFEGASRMTALESEVAGVPGLLNAYRQKVPEQLSAQANLQSLVERYRRAPEFAKLASTTKAQWRPWLDEIGTEFGSLPLKSVGAKGVRRCFLEWRDKRASTPRTADYGVQVLRRILAYGLEHEMVGVNPLVGVRSLYSANRADQIIEDLELASILANMTPHAIPAIKLAAETGMRRGDLVALRWEHIHEQAIRFFTAKSRGRKRVNIPITVGARAALNLLQIDRDRKIAAGMVPSDFVLTSGLGTPWLPNSLTQAFDRAKRKAAVDKHLHDLRGTAVTRFFAHGFTTEQVADIVGWEASRVSNIRKHYVDQDILVQEALALLERRKNAS